MMVFISSLAEVFILTYGNKSLLLITRDGTFVEVYTFDCHLEYYFAYDAKIRNYLFLGMIRTFLCGRLIINSTNGFLQPQMQK